MPCICCILTLQRFFLRHLDAELEQLLLSSVPPVQFEPLPSFRSIIFKYQRAVRSLIDEWFLYSLNPPSLFSHTNSQTPSWKLFRSVSSRKASWSSFLARSIIVSDLALNLLLIICDVFTFWCFSCFCHTGYTQRCRHWPQRKPVKSFTRISKPWQHGRVHTVTFNKGRLHWMSDTWTIDSRKGKWRFLRSWKKITCTCPLRT